MVGAGDILVGAGSARGHLPAPRLEQKTDLKGQQLAANSLRQRIRYRSAGGGIVH